MALGILIFLGYISYNLKSIIKETKDLPKIEGLVRIITLNHHSKSKTRGKQPT